MSVNELSAMKVSELKELALGLGIDIADLKKEQLVESIGKKQGVSTSQEGGESVKRGRGRPKKVTTEGQSGEQGDAKRERDNNNRDGEQSNHRDRNQAEKGESQEERQGFRKRERNNDRRRNYEDGDAYSNQNDRQNGRERNANDRNNRSSDQELIPVAGIIDVLDNFGFVRTSGYLPAEGDVYISSSVLKKFGLRHGDAITGRVKDVLSGIHPKQLANPKFRTPKFNPLQEVDTINGMSVEEAAKRPHFNKLTPLYPQERLRQELPADSEASKSAKLTARVIDLVAPIGKGQRALIVAPPKAGKTIMMQHIANSISANNPEVHLMVVLVDERPEEVTDMQRSVRGEVISSTFDRPPVDHTTVAELAIERAKRLVEMGKDVVILLDSITRLARAYNFVAPVSGRVLSGGVDAAALYPPKKFLGAARNIEEGGSLTIIASALVETGSKMDEVIFEEFKGTGNQEIRLSRQIADKRIFPAVDVITSGTRREEWLMNPDELKVMHSLHRVLGGLEVTQALELLLEQLKKTGSNLEFLLHVQKTTPQVDTL